MACGLIYGVLGSARFAGSFMVVGKSLWQSHALPSCQGIADGPWYAGGFELLCDVRPS